MKWSEEEMEIIKKYDNKEDFIKFLPSRSWDSIKKFRKKISPEKIKSCIKWSEYEISFLKDNYENMVKEDLIKFLPGRSWDSIKLKSNSIDISRSHDFTRKSNMYILMEDELESFYWIGFILADGHISNSERIKISLSNKDRNHLQKFVDYLGCSDIIEKDSMCSTSLQNKEICIDLCNKFNIKSNKTYEPLDFKLLVKYNNELIFSLIIGFIDGDGCINKVYKRQDCNLRIHLHNSWLNNLIFIEDFVYEYFLVKKNRNYSHISNDGYSLLNISNNEIIKKLKKECIKLNLPIMSRKWDNIDENRLSRSEKFDDIRNSVIKMYCNNISPIDIINKLKLKKGVVYKYIREYKKVI